MTMIGSGFWETPGISTVLQTTENVLWWGRRDWQKVQPAVILSTAVDAGHSPTTVLRQGLIMGLQTSSGKILQWNPAATDGTERIYGILMVDQSMLTNNTAKDRFFGYCLVGGTLKGANLIVPGAAGKGIAANANEYLIRALLTQTGRFLFDDDIPGTNIGGWSRFETMAATTRTIVAADQDTLFLCAHTSLTAFTLPAPRIGLRYGFFAMDDSGFSVTSAPADQLVTYNDVAADSITVNTTTKVIGTMIEVLGISATQWAVMNRMTGSGTLFTNVTVAT